MNYLLPRINRLEKEFRFATKKYSTYLIYEKEGKFYQDYYCTKEWIEPKINPNTFVVRVIYQIPERGKYEM